MLAGRSVPQSVAPIDDMFLLEILEISDNSARRSAICSRYGGKVLLCRNISHLIPSRSRNLIRQISTGSSGYRTADQPPQAVNFPTSVARLSAFNMRGKYSPSWSDGPDGMATSSALNASTLAWSKVIAPTAQGPTLMAV